MDFDASMHELKVTKVKFLCLLFFTEDGISRKAFYNKYSVFLILNIEHGRQF